MAVIVYQSSLNCNLICFLFRVLEYSTIADLFMFQLLFSQPSILSPKLGRRGRERKKEISFIKKKKKILSEECENNKMRNARIFMRCRHIHTDGICEREKKTEMKRRRQEQK